MVRRSLESSSTRLRLSLTGLTKSESRLASSSSRGTKFKFNATSIWPAVSCNSRAMRRLSSSCIRKSRPERARRRSCARSSSAVRSLTRPSNSSRACFSASSAPFLSLTSMHTPISRRGRPEASRITWPRASIQPTVPSSLACRYSV